MAEALEEEALVSDVAGLVGEGSADVASAEEVSAEEVLVEEASAEEVLVAEDSAVLVEGEGK